MTLAGKELGINPKIGNPELRTLLSARSLVLFICIGFHEDILNSFYKL